MKRTILTGILAAAACCGALVAQPATVQQGPAPKAQPKAKSQAEAQAVNAMIQSQSAGPDAMIKAADDLVTKFADTEFKEIAYTFEAQAYQKKNDVAKAEFFDEEILKMDPSNSDASLQLAELIVTHTGENDLDKEEKLAKAETLLHQTMDNVKVAPKPSPQVPDDKWEAYKKGTVAEAQVDLARSAMLRKKYDDAIAAYKAANDADPQPAYQAYLAQAYQKAGKNDDALALCDKLLSDAQLNPQIKQYVQNVQRAANAAKGAK